MRTLFCKNFRVIDIYWCRAAPREQYFMVTRTYFLLYGLGRNVGQYSWPHHDGRFANLRDASQLADAPASPPPVHIQQVEYISVRTSLKSVDA